MLIGLTHLFGHVSISTCVVASQVTFHRIVQGAVAMGVNRPVRRSWRKFYLLYLMVGHCGLEPQTPVLSGPCSNQLS